jgi:argininosuccinate synthase
MPHHTSYESGMLEDPMTPPLKDMFKMVSMRTA